MSVFVNALNPLNNRATSIENAVVATYSCVIVERSRLVISWT